VAQSLKKATNPTSIALTRHRKLLQAIAALVIAVAAAGVLVAEADRAVAVDVIDVVATAAADMVEAMAVTAAMVEGDATKAD
jgi:hypothetical protein